jgi:hypothetical protein
MDEQLKWVFAAGGLGLVGYAFWQFASESAKVAIASRRERQPWEIE